MTQYERMEKGLLYDPGDPEILDEQRGYQERLWEFNRLKASDTEEKEKYMKEIFASCGENSYVELPLHANWGGAHLFLGSGVYINSSLTLVDDGYIHIEDKVMVGPNVTIVTAGHPVLPELRARGLQFNKDVYICENAWIGAGVTILPGIRIGKNAVIGAGSIVTKDIPDDSIAVGNPCRVIRKVGEQDRKYFYKQEPIDWENLE